MEILLITLVVLGSIFFVGRLVRSHQRERQQQLEDNYRYIQHQLKENIRFTRERTNIYDADTLPNAFLTASLANTMNQSIDSSSTTPTDNFTGGGGDFGGAGASGSYGVGSSFGSGGSCDSGSTCD